MMEMCERRSSLSTHVAPARPPLEDVTNHRRRRLWLPARVSQSLNKQQRAQSPLDSPRLFETPKENVGEELLCAEYVDEMYEEFLRKEESWHYPNYFDKQTELNPRMRAILVDWLVDVHLKFRLAESTLYLAVQIVDAYLAKRQTGRTLLQLVGITALLLASKYEDVEAPEISDCTYVCHETYEASQVMAMEIDILKTLEWRITKPNAHVWLMRIMSVVGADEHTRHAAEYYAQRLLLELDAFDFKPSLVAASAAWLAFGSKKARYWPQLLQDLTGYSQHQLQVCGDVLEYYVRQDQIVNRAAPARFQNSRQQHRNKERDDSPPLVAVLNKFSSERYCRVAAAPDHEEDTDVDQDEDDRILVVTPSIDPAASARPNKRPRSIKISSAHAVNTDDDYAPASTQDSTTTNVLTS